MGNPDTVVRDGSDARTRTRLVRTRRGKENEHSGFVIVRLNAEVPATAGDSLIDVAKRSKLGGLATALEAFKVTTTRRLVRSLAPEKIIELERSAASTEFPPLRSLTSYWRIDLRDRPEAIDDVVKRLNALPEVDHAYRELAVSEPAVNAVDDDYAVDQDYLDAAPTGIDARWAWTQPDCEGAGIAVVDLEQGWFPNHEDLVAKTPTLIFGDNRDGVNGYKGNHGTAVLGEMIGVDNTVGVVGIAPAVTSVRMVSHYDAATDTALHVADAITAAIPAMSAGDVLLLEVQRGIGQPTETDDGDFDAIRLAVASGITVVEAAGNGSVNLDTFVDAMGDNILNRTSPDFRDSGAVMVGAAESALPHDRAGFSCFGSRIDCYGWGENVVTCGYGFLDNGGGNDNLTYTDIFNGTSSASPIVSGAALVVQGKYQALTGTRLSPTQMRTLLADPATGTAQGPNVAGNIGVMPNLRAIIETTLGLVPDIYLRDNVGDTGVTPSAGSISASPDIIVRPALVADPVAEFGEGSGQENSSTLGFEVEAGQDNFLYVRIQNRGASDANSVTATIYWSEVATLVTPATWHLIGTTAAANVPQGDTIVVAGPLTWPASQIPATGHYCFVGLLQHVQDPAPPIPGPTDWNGFTSLIRNQNNVTWRNFNVVDELPDPGGDPAILPFLIAGAPDRARLFDLEVFRDLPRDAKVVLQIPLGLAAKLRHGRLWKMEVDRKQRFALLELPPLPRFHLGAIRLGPRAKYPARFLVHGVPGMEKGGHGIAIRQLFEKDEVGRVTWQFHLRKGAKNQGRGRRASPEYSPTVRELQLT
ncbi:MAG TPA: S8 family peptidase [Gemmatimonadaceae bacterium]|nr:S8 family peptidase [Gemmatimonadaceae bacterium]